MLAVGGLYNPRNNEYNEQCEVFDLQSDEWTRNAYLKIERLAPFAVPVGAKKALVIGGFRRNNLLEEMLIRQCEIVDASRSLSYFTASNYKLPVDAKTVVGVFKLNQEKYSYSVKNRKGELGLEDDESPDHYQRVLTESSIASGEDTDFDKAEASTPTERASRQKIEICLETIVVVYLNQRNMLCT